MAAPLPRAAIGGPGENAPKWCREVPAETEAAARIGGEFHLRRKKIGCWAKFFSVPVWPSGNYSRNPHLKIYFKTLFQIQRLTGLNGQYGNKPLKLNVFYSRGPHAVVTGDV
ncbi:hypothetical protein [Maritimibacter alkaliphilus]|uniref:hypothetical protein n=1 Tax=Maritimibacter alkaliphilus TaxID=404236 RepID=UPI001C975B7A|nr:hypothetical protein [Maritimibacter alkaliphilus]MBY6092018.1 hypothetical protein [Maritimibacter alkaliphilus]